jgi:hypothetical protein
MKFFNHRQHSVFSNFVFSTIIFSSFIWLQGCATTNSLAKISAEMPNDKVGYVLASYSITCKDIVPIFGPPKCMQAFNSMSTTYFDTSDKSKVGRFEFVTGKMFGDDDIPDVASPAEHTRFYCLRLPVGNYSFRTVNFYNFAGGGSGYSINEKEYFNVPFVVEPNTIRYIGSFKLTTTLGKNMLGSEVLAPGQLEIGSNQSRDIPAALKKCDSKIPSKDSILTLPVNAGAIAAHPALLIK